MNTFAHIQKELDSNANPEKSSNLQRFFKTGPGEYGEGDIFLGLNMPTIRRIAKANKEADFSEVRHLLASGIHEYRLCGFILLTYKFKAANDEIKTAICNFYLENLDSCNNWDLVDCSASEILGNYLLDKDTSVLDELSQTGHLWRERVSMVATYAFIKKDIYTHTFRIAEILLHHKHDLIHKAVGWMLREAGKRDQNAETTFLKNHYKTMPRTMLRYAIEKYPESERQAFLKGTFK